MTTGDDADLLNRLQTALPPWFDQVLLAASDSGGVVPVPDDGELDFSNPDNSVFLASAG